MHRAAAALCIHTSITQNYRMLTRHLKPSSDIPIFILAKNTWRQQKKSGNGTHKKGRHLGFETPI